MLILGLGSNLSAPSQARVQPLKEAIWKLTKGETALFPAHRFQCRISSLYESDALLPEGAPESWNRPFLNLALKIEGDFSKITPSQILKRVKEIEKEIGRVETTRWAPRVIDIDILAWGDLILEEGDLCIPHSQLLKRAFALWPLAELTPMWKPPHSHSTAKELALAMKRNSADSLNTQLTTEKLFPTWMGILNITPDSFSDGRIEFMDPQLALSRALVLIEEGAEIIDIGAESTRPGASVITAEEEWKRLDAILKTIIPACRKAHPHIQFSIDTFKPTTAAKALEAGVDWINDVNGLNDPQMLEVLRKSGAKAVFMHSLSVPARKDLTFDANQNPVQEVLVWAQRKIKQFEEEGISKRQLIFDPGIGFGKTPAQSMALLKQCEIFHLLGVEILVGHSRKSFLSHLQSTSLPHERDPETALISHVLAQQRVDVIRVHDVGMNRRITQLGAHFH